MSNYNIANYEKRHKRYTDHNWLLLSGLESTKWDTFHGNGLLENLGEDHHITRDSIGLAYLAIVSSNVATNDRIPIDVKIDLCRYLKFYFDRLFDHHAIPGVWGNLSLGYIVRDHNSKLDFQLVFYRKMIVGKEENYIFSFSINGKGAFTPFTGSIVLTGSGKIYQHSLGE